MEGARRISEESLSLRDILCSKVIGFLVTIIFILAFGFVFFGFALESTCIDFYLDSVPYERGSYTKDWGPITTIILIPFLPIVMWIDLIFVLITSVEEWLPAAVLYGGLCCYILACCTDST